MIETAIVVVTAAVLVELLVVVVVVLVVQPLQHRFIFDPNIFRRDEQKKFFNGIFKRALVFFPLFLCLCNVLCRNRLLFKCASACIHSSHM